MDTAKKILAKLSREYGGIIEEPMPVVIEGRVSPDGTAKLLLALKDSLRIESVILPFHRRHTICLSSQVGCAMGCTFCLTGARSLVRNLTAAEIVGQYLACYQWLIDRNPGRHTERPNIVFMGEGEPLHNFSEVKDACAILLSSRGVHLGPRQITLSTMGYLPGLERLNELSGINIALSLHSAFPSKRKQLIPLESRHPLEKILEILGRLPLMKKQYINFEYLLIAGFNDGVEDALALAELTERFQSFVNIIPYNELPGFNWKTPDESAISGFKAILTGQKVRTLVRVSKGRDILAACGQLSGSRK